MKRFATCVLGLLLLCSGSASAQLYKWVDINGRTRYGDVPPPGLNVEQIRSPATPPGAAPVEGAAKDSKQGPRTPAEMEIEFRRRQQEARDRQEERAKTAAEALVKAENCERAQEGLRNLESGRRVARLDANGERYFPDEAAIEKNKADIRKIMDENCK